MCECSTQFNIYDLLKLLCYREAALLAESELAGYSYSIDEWKSTLTETEREVLDVYERSVQRTFDGIVSKATGGIN